ncbi:MAG: glycosyltransferase family 2 protein [Eubacteriales bacterium]
MLEKISVIVPVYKVEPYLRKCVDSILNQTYRNLEVILVDDGSPDSCGAICEEYAAKDARVRVIHKPNGGLSDARNAGMDIMTGKYVAFVDSDDWIEAHMYHTLLTQLLRFDADIAMCDAAVEIQDGDTVSVTKAADYGSAPFAERNTDAMRRFLRTSCAAWDKLYKAELFDDLRFPMGEINEDEAIMLRLLDRCKTVCYTGETCYHYVRRTDGQSITTSSFSAKKLVWVRHCRDNLAFVREKYPELEPYAAARYRGSLLWALREIALSEESFDAEVQQLKIELRTNAVPFRQAPFENRQDRLRYNLLQYFPLGVYRAILRLRHRNGKEG